METLDLEKVIYLVKTIHQKDSSKEWFVDILNFSDFIFKDHWNQNSFPHLYNLKVLVNSEIFIKYNYYINAATSLLRQDLEKYSDVMLDEVVIQPDYSTLNIVDNHIKPVYTEWDEINKLQTKLLDQLTFSTVSVEFQNIGNSSRSLLEKLSNLVFDPLIHKPSKPEMDVSPSKYKNR